MNSQSQKASAALFELGKADYESFIPLLPAHKMNTLFARAVLEQYAPGQVLVDSPESPRVIYVIHGYGISLLFGSEERSDVQDAVVEQIVTRARAKAEWLQVYPQSWAAQFEKYSAVERNTRVNFKFSADEYELRRPLLLDPSRRISQADALAFAMPGLVVPSAFWIDAEHFLKNGLGFSVILDSRPVSLAFSAFVTPAQLEIGIETLEGYRGRGLATQTCVALIDYCLEHGLEPVWSCRLENEASYRLAETLGFVPTLQLPFLCLPPTC